MNHPSLAEDIEAARKTLDEMLAYLEAKRTHHLPEEKAIALLANTMHLTNCTRPANYRFSLLINALAMLRLLKLLPPSNEVLTLQE